MDGVSRKTRVDVSLQLKAPTEERIEQVIWLEFPTSNNEAEYETILVDIDLAISISSKNIIIRSDSQLVVGQVNEEYETRDQHMNKYVCLVKLRLESFMAWKLEYIPRGSNEKIDALATMASTLPTKETVLLPVYYQPEPSIAANRVNNIEEAYPSWMTPIVRYLISRELPDSRVKAHKIPI